MNQKQITCIVTVAMLLIGGVLWYGERQSETGLDTAGVDATESREQQDEKMIEEIKQGVKEDYPYLDVLEKEKSASLFVEVETLDNSFAIGKYFFGQEQSNQSGTWFAEKIENHWQVFNVSSNYFGICQKFWQHSFPKELTPDCWDEEKNFLVETSNPTLFFNNDFTVKDKEVIKIAFLEYLNTEAKEYLSSYKNKTLFVAVDANTQNHMRGRIFFGGTENRSTPFILATKVQGLWKVVYQGQDGPYCETIDIYSFPVDVVPFCISPDEKNKGEYITRWR